MELLEETEAIGLEGSKPGRKRLNPALIGFLGFLIPALIGILAAVLSSR
jgi:hypothetical protein